VVIRLCWRSQKEVFSKGPPKRHSRGQRAFRNRTPGGPAHPARCGVGFHPRHIQAQRGHGRLLPVTVSFGGFLLIPLSSPLSRSRGNLVVLSRRGRFWRPGSSIVDLGSMFALVSGTSKPSPEFLAGVDVGIVLNRAQSPIRCGTTSACLTLGTAEPPPAL